MRTNANGEAYCAALLAVGTAEVVPVPDERLALVAVAVADLLPTLTVLLEELVALETALVVVPEAEETADDVAEDATDELAGPPVIVN